MLLKEKSVKQCFFYLSVCFIYRERESWLENKSHSLWIITCFQFIIYSGYTKNVVENIISCYTSRYISSLHLSKAAVKNKYVCIKSVNLLVSWTCLPRHKQSCRTTNNDRLSFANYNLMPCGQALWKYSQCGFTTHLFNSYLYGLHKCIHISFNTPLQMHWLLRSYYFLYK